MALTRFEQDPTQPRGTGNFFDETGKATYATDPEEAKRLAPTLADQVNQQSTAAAVATVGAPPAAPDARVASNEGATGSAALGPPPDPAAPASPAAQLVAKTSQVAAGASAIPPAAAAPPAKPAGAGAALVGKLGQLPVAQTSTSTSVQKGRDAGKVETEIGSLRKADAGLDTQMRAGAESGDVRTQKAAEGEQALALGEYARNYTAEQQERQRKEQIESEITALSGEKDADTNPTRLLDDMSTGKSIGMVLLAGIAGAFGNMHGEGRNTFLDAIDKRMDQDLQNQRDQIASGRLRRNNRIAYLQSQGADAKQAQAAYEARVYGAAADWARAQIKAQSLQGAQLEQANLAIAQLEQGRAARDAQLREATESKYATTSNVVREAPKAAGEGMNPLQLIQLQNALLDQQDAAEISKIVGKNLSPERVKELKATVKEVGSGVSETDGAIDMTNNLVESLGGKLDTTTGKVVWPDDLKGAGFWGTLGQSGVSSYTPPGLAARAAKGTGLVRTDYDRAVAAQSALKEYVTKNLTGANSNARQDATFTQMTGGSLANEDEVKENVQNWANTVFAMRNGQLSRLGEDGQALLEHNSGRAKQGNGAPPLVAR